MSAFVGVDIGGTFTDIVLSEHGALTIHKLLSTPHDPSQAMLAGMMAVAGELARLSRVIHGSTVATNAILERKGARAAFVTTAGFRDMLTIGRQNRPPDMLYALYPTLPPPLIPRERCYEIRERLDTSGAVLIALEDAALDALYDDIAAGVASGEITAVAVCLLYSFVNPAHEQRIRERLAALPVEIVLSSEVLPEFREYERASATTLEAYVRPVMSRYVSHLAARLPVPLRIMKSDGGVMNAARVGKQAIQTALSGPAAGVAGAFYIASLAGYDRIITLDMGGTSTDVALCPSRLIQRADSQIDGLPLRIRLLDIETVGAGGGSIARVDSGGALRVGPESAGADPGPVCYGRGGTQVTVSDANAVLGRLDAGRFLGGRMTLDIGAAREALGQLAASVNMSIEDVARGVLEVANANIDRAVRRVSIARGYDPRELTLVAFGGAGALHACAVAARLDMPRVLIPRFPGVLCAFGLLVAEMTLETSRSVLRVLASDDDSALLMSLFDAMIEETRAELLSEGIDAADMHFQPIVEMRYAGQAYELPITPTMPLETDSLITRFHTAHTAAYGHALKRPVEIVTARLTVTVSGEKPALNPEPLTPASLTGGRYERDALHPGATFQGEALVYQMDSTVYIPAGWVARVDAYRNLILERR